MEITIDELQKYRIALTKCAKEHENDRTMTGNIVVTQLCRDTANLLETLEHEALNKTINAKCHTDFEERKKQELLDMMKDMSLSLLHLVYLEARYYNSFGVNITQKLNTATQNAEALEKAYKKGYYECLETINLAKADAFHSAIEKGYIMELKDTIKDMCSEDYKERFKAEYWQLRIRRHKLAVMLNKYHAGDLQFTPDTPIEILEAQLGTMNTYVMLLKHRAEIEGIDLE